MARDDWLARLTDRLIHPRLRTSQNHADLRRARFMVLSSGLVFPLLLAYSVRELLLFPSDVALRRIGINVAFGIVHAGILLTIRFYGRVFVPGNLAAAMPFAGIIFGFFRNMSVVGPASLWAVATPVLGTAYAGRKSGLAWAALAIGAVLILQRSFASGSIPVRAEHLSVMTTVIVILFLTAVMFIYDVKTDRMIEEIQAYRGRAEASVRSQRRFLANMSHEIRTPMTTILGYADELLEGGDLRQIPPERLQAVHSIRRSGYHLLQIINDILDLSKIEAGRLEIERTQFSVCQTLAEVKSMLEPAAGAKGLALTLDYPTALPERVSGDPMRLRQVLVNLVSNAIKFTETGTIRIVTRLLDPREVPKLRFEIVDTGIGIHHGALAALFDPFEQGDASTTRRYGGTGLGLSICRHLVELMGGTIAVQSTPGHGSTFAVTLPIGSLDGIALIQNPGELAASGQFSSRRDHQERPRLEGGCRVLLAEDAPDNQRLIRLILERAGADVEVVGNGQAALERVLASWEDGNPFDVVLMDMQMPVLDGYDATRALRSAGYPGPILALTAHALIEERTRYLEAGCDDFASKPVDRAQLIEMVGRYGRLAKEGTEEGRSS